MIGVRGGLVQRVARRICRQMQRPLALQLQATTARGFAGGMDAFMEFEREMALKRMQNEPRAARLQRVAPLEPPEKPKDDECCKLDCPNCVLLVYQEKLLEYELSLQRQSVSHVLAPLKPEPKYNVRFLDSDAPSPAQLALLRENNLAVFPIAANDVISAPHRTKDDWWRSVRHIDLRVTEAQRHYVGDDASNVAVFVPNSAATVDHMLAHLHVDPDLVFTAESIVRSDSDQSHGSSHIVSRPFERIGSVRDALTWSLDLEGAPRPGFLKTLAAFASDPDDVDALSMPQALDALQAERPGHAVSIADVFDRFPSLHVPFDAFLQFAPQNAPRYYTVSSSRAFFPDRVSITLGLKKRAEQPVPRCSSYLAALTPGRDAIRAAFFRSSFVFPRADRRPILLVSAGTGIAPFRAFIQDLEHEREAEHAVGAGASHRQAYLFYGCRSPDIDFLYRDEITQAHDQRVLDALHVVYSSTSTETSVSQPKRYVQDALADESALVVRHLVHEQGHVFVCGSLAMGRAVKQTIASALVTHGEASSEREAKALVTQWIASGQIVTELW